MSPDDEWREFERLAARIEQALAPQGAIVTSPDRIPDLLTGSLREVDASVRFQIGSAPILITIECRRRGAVQDDTWIEQLATKKEKVGAAKTIAVSASGFSEPATITARLKGIELRNLRGITNEEILTWLRSVVLTKVGLHVVVKTISATLDGHTPETEYRFEPEPPTGGIRTLIRVHDGQFVSPYEMWNLAIRSNLGLLRGVRLDGAKEVRLVQVDLPSGAIQVQRVDGPQLITSMTFEIECWHETKSGPLTDGTYYEYSSPDGHLLQGAEFKTEIEGIPFILGVQLRPKGKPPGS